MNSSNTSRGTTGEPAGSRGPGRTDRTSRNRSDWYEIRVQGCLDDRWAAWFDGLDLSRTNDGTTVLRGPVTDQAALHGLLHRLRDLGVPLLSVTQTDPAPPD